MEDFEKKAIHFVEDIPGFQGENEFWLIPSENPEFPFHHLESQKNEKLSFVVTDPFLFIEGYDFDLSEGDMKKLKLTGEEDLKDVVVLSFVTIPQTIEDCTINIMAPVVINMKDALAKQVVLKEYDQTRYPLFKGEA